MDSPAAQPTSPDGADATESTVAPDRGERPRGPRRGRVLFATLLLGSAAVWASGAVGLGRWLPERAWQQDVATVSAGGVGLDAAVARLCAADAGRDALAEAWASTELARRSRLERALFQRGCLDVLPAEAQHRFLRQEGAWALSDLELSSEGALARLTDVLEHGDAAAQASAARALLGQPEALRGADVESAAYRLALAHVEQPWGLALLDAIDTPEAVGAALGRYLALPEGDPPPAELEQLVLSRWAELPAWARQVLVGRWLTTAWRFRSGGAIKQPQPVGLDVCFVPPPSVEPLAGAVAYARATTFLLDGSPLRVAGTDVAEQVGGVVLTDAGAWLGSVDVSPHFLVHGKHVITATVEVALLPAGARDAEVVDAGGRLLEPWRTQALYVETRGSGPRPYREYLGVDYGGPETLHEGALDARVAEVFDVVWAGAAQEVVLRRGGALATERPPIAFAHGGFSRIVLRAQGPVAADQGLRIQALRRDQPKAVWIDIGEAVIRDNDRWPNAPPAQLPIGLGEVCPNPGPCALELRLRSSLRVARTDPRIESYWGETLPLGAVVVEVSNTADGHHWPQLYARLRGLAGGGP